VRIERLLGGLRVDLEPIEEEPLRRVGADARITAHQVPERRDREVECEESALRASRFPTFGERALAAIRSSLRSSLTSSPVERLRQRQSGASSPGDEHPTRDTGQLDRRAPAQAARGSWGRCVHLPAA
jgi:hypothetical protein